MTAEQDDIHKAIEAVIDLAIAHHQNEDGETYTECRLCGDWEGHEATCPLPTLIAFMEAPA